MLKKLLCVILSVTVLLSLVCCAEIEIPNFETNNTTTASPQNDSSENENNSEKPESSSTSSQKPNTDKPSLNSSQKSEIIVEKPPQNVESENTSVSSPSIEIPEEIDTNHIAVLKEDYFQYSLLNTKEKAVYNDICNAIEITQNVVNLKKYNVEVQTVCDVYEKVIADNPQYFWVTKMISYTCYSVDEQSIFVDLYLHYTDGKTVDVFDKNNKLTAIADRNEISNQIKNFNNKITEFLSNVSAATPDFEKEKLIHDFVVKSVSYDYDNMNSDPSSKTDYPRIWDAYGALCDGKAVCEGYARLFQILCYHTGINANFVRGESQNQPHAWNVVKLDNEWYHVDVTWDDSTNDKYSVYVWFNLTTEQIETDHLIEDDILKVPDAYSKKYSFEKTFGISITSLDEKPENFENAIDYVIKFKDEYLIVNLNGLKVSSKYINEYFMKPTSEIQIYLKSKDKSLVLNAMTTLGGHMYLKVK